MQKPLWKIWGISNHSFYSRSHSQNLSAFHYSCITPLIWYLKNTSLKGKFYDRNPEYRDYTLSRSSWSSLDKINERKILSPGSTVYMNIHSHYSVNSLKLTHTLTRTCYSLTRPWELSEWTRSSFGKAFARARGVSVGFLAWVMAVEFMWYVTHCAHDTSLTVSGSGWETHPHQEGEVTSAPYIMYHSSFLSSPSVRACGGSPGDSCGYFDLNLISSKLLPPGNAFFICNLILISLGKLKALGRQSVYTEGGADNWISYQDGLPWIM